MGKLGREVTVSSGPSGRERGVQRSVGVGEDRWGRRRRIVAFVVDLSVRHESWNHDFVDLRVQRPGTVVGRPAFPGAGRASQMQSQKPGRDTRLGNGSRNGAMDFGRTESTPQGHMKRPPAGRQAGFMGAANGTQREASELTVRQAQGLAGQRLAAGGHLLDRRPGHEDPRLCNMPSRRRDRQPPGSIPGPNRV